MSAIALLAWGAWALVTFEIGVRIMPQPQTRSSVGELLRTSRLCQRARIKMIPSGFFSRDPASTCPNTG